MKSTPRVTPYSLSPPFRCFRFREDPGAGGDLFRFWDVDADGSAVSRWVDITLRLLVIQAGAVMEKTHALPAQPPLLRCRYRVQQWQHSRLMR